ncbi:MAG: hypothetical protein AAGB32_03945 [Pseudomonadota bacterium]
MSSESPLSLTTNSTLKSIIPNCDCDVDFSAIASNDGSSQTISNLISNPVIAQQEDYDFFLGNNALASSDDPLLVGTAGTYNAYYSYDGNDTIDLKDITGTCIADAHRTDKPFFMTTVFLTNSSPNGNMNILGNSRVSSDLGIRLRIGSDEKLDLFISDGTEQIGRSLNNVILQPNTWYFLAITMNETGNIRSLLNNDYFEDFISKGTSTTPSTEIFSLGGVRGVSEFDNGWGLRQFGCGQSYLDGNTLLQLRDFLSIRHQHNYSV